ncbi:MAG: Zn2+/Cd2+-exporting ATPase [Pseudomonadota bacterium]|nr:Zn2+/Cd2+-exporting ATPase [Pseudomonadota bacterium]
MAHDSHDHHAHHNHGACASTAPAPCCSAGCGGHAHAQDAHPEWRYGLALLLALTAEALHYAAPATGPWQWVGMGLAVCAIVLAGFSTYRAGLVDLRQGRFGINALMAVAVTGAFAIGQWPEAAMVMALYAIAELIEERSVERARGAIQGLMQLAPEQAEVRQHDGRWATVAAAQVQPGQVFRVKPGERIALDATLTVGATTVNQAAITGESLPLDRSVGDTLFAGTVNLTATIEAVATHTSADSLLERIIRTVEQAQAARAPTQALVDRFAAVYTPAVFVIALAVAVLGPLALGWPWLQGVYKALVLLVIACPCALVISTPVAVVSALAAAARRGILVKGGVHLENARKIRTIAFDKTGTLTEGTPRLVEALVLPGSAHAAQALHWAADMAAHSNHPVSSAIAQGLTAHACDAELVAFESLPGLGVKAQAHGMDLWLGNHRLIESLGVCNPALEAALAAHEAQGHTVAVLASRTQALALLAVADTIRPSARPAIAQLQALGIETTMLSGDNQAVADTMARAAGLAQARGGLLPHDKLAAIAALQRSGQAVAMVGDGINDAPALAASNLGIAMGGTTGTDIAMETADVAILNDDLRRIPELIALSRRTQGILVQNIALALAIKATFLVLAVLGSATMWMAVFADMGASLLVVGNSLRLLRAPAPH